MAVDSAGRLTSHAATTTKEQTPTYFANRATNACRLDGVPVGVFLQVKQKPNPVCTNHVTNGLLLRADLHTLLDLGRIMSEPRTYSVVVASDLHGTDYREFHGVRIHLPADANCWPDDGALRAKYELGAEVTGESDRPDV